MRRNPKITTLLDRMTSVFDEALADGVASSLDLGIDEVYDEEATQSREVVMSAFIDFRGNMEILKVSHLVYEVTSTVHSETTARVDFIWDILPSLIEEFKAEAVVPFDNDCMAETQAHFLFDGAIVEYDEMKMHTVEQMNDDHR